MFAWPLRGTVQTASFCGPVKNAFDFTKTATFRRGSLRVEIMFDMFFFLFLLSLDLLHLESADCMASASVFCGFCPPHGHCCAEWGSKSSGSRRSCA